MEPVLLPAWLKAFTGETHAEPWPETKRRELRAIAFRELTDHGHDRTSAQTPMDAEEWALVQDNCATCQHEMARRSGTEPNVAGWLRVWVQGGWAVPMLLAESEVARVVTENPAYLQALLRDIATFGFNAKKEA